MKRQTFMKSTLCLLMALVCNVAWAQPAISDAPSDGQWAQNTKWFRMETGDDYSYRADVLTADGYLALTNKVDAVGDVALWCIVGDEEKGYHFYNRAKGAAVVLGMKNGYAEFVAAGTSGYITAFDFVRSQKTENTYWCAKEHGSTNNFLNRKNNGDYHLQFWNSASASGTDNGSAMLFTEVDLSTLTELYAPEGDITAAQALIKDALGYPKTTTAQYHMLNVMVNSVGKGIVASELSTAVTAYKTCSDVILPENDKAYTIANYTKTGKTRYLNYTSGSALSVKEGNANASVFVCRELSAGVYAFVTEDGKVLTWMGGTDGFQEGGSLKGYSSEYGMEQDGLYDWNKITVKSNRNTSDGTDLGLLRLVARRSSSYPSASWVVNVANDNWNHNSSDGYNFDGNHSSAWIFTAVTSYTNTEAQNLALAKIDAKVRIEGMKLGSYCLVDKNGNKLTNLKSAYAAVDAAESQTERDALLASRSVNLPTSGQAYYLKDSQGTYLDIHHLAVEANDRNNSTQLASLSKTKQLLYITGNETDGTWKIHTLPEGGKYLHQKPQSRVWNSWVSDAGRDFKWEVEGVDVSGTPHYMLKNISGSENGILGPNNSSHTNAGEPLFVNQKVDANKLKMQLLPVKSITGLASTAGEWLNEECVNVATVDEIPQGIKNLSNYNNFVNAEYTQKVITSGEHFYINAGRLTGLFSWHSGSGSKRVNIVAVEVVDLAGAVVAADYHWGFAGNPSSNNTYSVDVPEDGLYYLRYYAETASNGGVNNSDVDITYTLVEKNVDRVEEFVQGGVYTFVTSLGWMGATAGSSNVISTARTNVAAEDKSADNPYFQWTVYKSNNGNYYLYNIGKEMFMGVQSTGNASVPFTENPAGKTLTFKNGNKTGYPILLSTDNKGSVNHSSNHGEGLITWSGGWNDLTDNGNSHQVTLVSQLPAATLQEIANKVEAYDKRLYVRTEVEMSENNPNTHFGSVRATSTSGTLTTKLKRGEGVVMLDYDGLNKTTVDFTREYRGFEFQGFKLGEQELGKSFTLTEEQKASITEENPLVAKFDTTEAVTLFYDDDAAPYRIPAIATTSTGRLIAVSDYRHCLDDIGLNRYGKGYRVDLVIRTSDDNGKTWSPIKTIAEGIDDSQANDCAYGDAAIAVVGEKVVVMAVAGSVAYDSGSAEPKKTNRLVRIYSANNGEDWVKEDITEQVYGYEGSLYPTIYTSFFGSGKLAVDPNIDGEGTARIYGPMLTQGMGNIVIYSDDMGLTWKKLGTGGQVAGANEPKIEILPNGQLLFSARRNGGRNFNVFTYTDKANGEGNWSNAVNGCNNEGQNGTNGETFLVDAKNARGENVKLLLQSQPVGGGAWDRANVSIWYKEISSDENHNHTPSEIAGGWTKGMQVSHQLSAYSTMSLQKDGRIAFFFEEAPCYQNEYKYGYCMVYMPLTIEEITKNKYFSLDADLTTERNISVVLTDAQGNEYRKQITSALGDVADKLTTDYPFITLEDNATLESADGTNFTYTNTVTLPFKVSNENTTVWHNIYWHGRGDNELVYLYGGAANDGFVAKVAPGLNIPYGNSDYNTAEKADNMSWAFYHAGNFTFTLKNKLTNKYVKVTSVANGDSKNATFVEEEATAFEIVTKTAGQTYKGDYSFKATVNDAVGYLCNTSASYGWTTHYTGNGHEGGWATIVEAPDFETLFGEVNAVLDMIGSGLGLYTVSETNATTAETAKGEMKNSVNVKLNDLNTYKGLLTGATLNTPQPGQFFRIRGISGNYIDASSIYNNANATTGQMSMKSAETCNYNGTIFYLDDDNHLLNYATGTYAKQTREIGSVGDSDKGVWTFTESTRNGVKGKYLLQCTVGSTGNGQHLHDNSGNRADRCSSNCGERHDFTLEEVTELPFTIAPIGYSTLYAPVALRIPEGVKAYTGTLSEENTLLTLTKVTTGIIPDSTGVVLYREATSEESTTHGFEIVPSNESNVTSDFSGCVAAAVKSGITYTLQTHTFSDANGGNDVQGVAFKLLSDGNNLKPFKAYLQLPEDEPDEQPAQALRMRFAGGTPTEVEMPIANGQQPTAIYDLQGRRVLNPTKGIYIVNGKKVIF